jgi:hypothetical protein
MSRVDPRLVAALAVQLERRDGERVGWKLGVGERESIGGWIAVGHLTSATLLEPGSTYRARGGDLHADAEVAVEVGRNGSIAAYGAALELVDLSIPPDDPYSVVVENVFHRAVAFGAWASDWSADGVEGSLTVNGEVRASARAADDLSRKLDEAGEILAAVGERLEPGDRVITGSVVQVPVSAGDEVVAELAPLGRAALSIA